ncbi:MAG TPA: class I SAM-dependent methyltransferase [Verrucomicrobiae bacterium]
MSNSTAPGKLKLRLTPAAEKAARSGHPWVYAERIKSQNRPGELGELAVVYDRNNTFMGVGLFDPDSPIRLRMIHAGSPTTIDDAWWTNRLHTALALREGLGGNHTTGYRLISGENDGWPGLVVDRYDNTLVLKLYSGVWLPRLNEITDRLQQTIKPQRIILRLSRNIQTLAQEKFSVTDGQILRGEPLEGIVVFQENGIRFESDVLRGQKTGFFLDQRDNRQRVGDLAQGKSVLNAFSFSGGFSLYAACGGAKSVTDLDISSHALDAANRNFALNEHLPTVKQCEHKCVQADAFKWVASTRERFDLVILDPPSLAKRETERTGAIAAYESLAANGIRLLNRGGILVAASCSAHVSPQEFYNAVLKAAQLSRRPFTEMDRTGHAPDHPATFPEAMYLKCIYLRFT